MAGSVRLSVATKGIIVGPCTAEVSEVTDGLARIARTDETRANRQFWRFCPTQPGPRTRDLRASPSNPFGSSIGEPIGIVLNFGELRRRYGDQGGRQADASRVAAPWGPRSETGHLDRLMR